MASTYITIGGRRYVDLSGGGTEEGPFVPASYIIDPATGLPASLGGGGDATAANQALAITALEALAATVNANDDVEVTLKDPSGDAVVLGPLEKTRLFDATITVGASQAAGDCMGGLITITDFAEVAGGSGTLTGLTLRSTTQPNQIVWVYLFRANPTASTFTDSAAAVLHADDRAKLIPDASWIIQTTDWTAPAVSNDINPFYRYNLIAPALGRGEVHYELDSGRDLYMVLVTAGAYTASTIFAVIAAKNDFE